MRRRCLELLVLVSSAISLACEQQPAPPASTPALAEETESPSARLLPVPLRKSEAEELDAAAGGRAQAGSEASEGAARLSEMLTPRSPLNPLTQVRGEAEATAGSASGVILEAAFAWPTARDSVRVAGQTIASWPTLRFELVPRLGRSPGRARVVLTSHVWPMPLGTELRSRSDHLGFIVVWPDGRSYRVVPQGALQALLLERRVDTMPLVPVTVEPAGEGKRLGRPTRRVRATGSAGKLTLELARMPESGLESGLMCDFLFGLIRAETPPETCDGGLVALAARFEWAEDRTLDFAVSQLSVRSDLSRGDYLVPPELAIWKPGELPPTSPDLWPLEVQKTLFPRDPDGPQIRFVNHRLVPLYLLIDAIPVSRIDPEAEVSFWGSLREHRYSARDFLGQVIEPGDVATPPMSVEFGQAPSIDGE